MTERKRKRIVYAVFVVAVLWGLFMQPWKRPAREHPAAPPAGSPAVAAVAAATADLPAERPSATRRAPGWTVNPFRPSQPSRPAEAPAESPDDTPIPVLQGIMSVGGQPSCVLDGKVYRVGDPVKGWRVTDIADGAVVLVGPDHRRRTVRAGGGSSR